MPSFDHRKLKEKILALDTPPSDTETFRQWVKAGAHLSFLKANAQANEVVIYGSGPYSFIHSIVVPDDQLDGAADDDLLHWSCNPYTSIASYVSGGGRESMWVERGGHGRGSKLLDTGKDLIFARTFEGWSGTGGTYFELNQEYALAARRAGLLPLRRERRPSTRCFLNDPGRHRYLPRHLHLG